MTLKLHNTLTRSTEEFTSQEEGRVKLYTCGPTVYNYLQVGNWAAYIYWDTLVRTLIANDYEVERVMNITDVGHLTSDADEGEDKLEKGARREGKTAWEVARMYGDDFLRGMDRLNLITPEHVTKATEYIPQQLELVRKLKQKGYTYQIDDGIYFDTSKFPTYADFAGLDLSAQQAGARVTFNDAKRNPSDFALWKFTPAGEKRDMEWETPADLLDSQTSSGVVVSDETSAARVSADECSTETRSEAVESDMTAPPANMKNHDSNTPSPSTVEPSETASRRAPVEYASAAARAADVSSDSTVDGPATEMSNREDSAFPAERAKTNNQLAASASEKLDTSADEQGTQRPVMGFPGWHLECSAMAMDILGNTLDIHTGGIDHIPVHHTNEIAQSEAATGERFSNYWLHCNFIKSNGTKISKSLGNGYTLDDLVERGYGEMDYRMFVLQSHYRSEGNFTFDNLAAAKNRLQNWRKTAALRWQVSGAVDGSGDEDSLSIKDSRQAMLEAMNNDLNTAEALKVVDETFATLESMLIVDIHHASLVALLEAIDELLGLGLMESTPDISEEQKQLVLERQSARNNKDWATSDQIRDKLAESGIVVRDTPSGSVWEYSQA